jgi:hypothetical protein
VGLWAVWAVDGGVRAIVGSGSIDSVVATTSGGSASWAHELALSTPSLTVIARQDGVATTSQLLGWGVPRDLVARRVSTGRWQRPHRGVVVLHSGPIPWRTSAQAALLYAGRGSALSHSSAGYVHRIRPQPGRLVEVSVPGDRFVRPSAGVVIHRRRVMPFAGGRLRVVGEDATVVDLLGAAADVDAAVGVIAAAMLRGLLPDRVLAEADQRARVRHRSLVRELLGPGSESIESPLEYRYARDVERAHRLPQGATQVRQLVGGRWIRADRVYDGVRVELDGQLAHPFGATDDDVWRDNAVVLAHREVTLRYRWRHVVAEPCATALQVGSALRRAGWRGQARRCGPQCTVA